MSIAKTNRKLQDRNKYYYDKHSSVEQLKLNVGESIIMKQLDLSKWEPATVVDRHRSPRSYIV